MRQMTHNQPDAHAFWIELVNRRVCENRKRRRGYCEAVAAYLARPSFLDVVGEEGRSSDMIARYAASRR